MTLLDRLFRFSVALLLALCSWFAAAQAANIDVPRDKGLPVVVNAGVAFIELFGFDENAGTFRATVDLRLSWFDGRLAKSGPIVGVPPDTYRDAAAEARMQEIWVPPAVLSNQQGEAAFSSYGLRAYPDGNVELLHRVTADFAVDVDVARFPFDRQQLFADVAVRGVPISQVTLQFDQSDIDFSRPSVAANLPGWSIGLVDLRSSPISSWYNTSEARVTASLTMARQPGLVVASIFIPLLASLLIPLLAIWLNRMEDGMFQVDAFELVNIIIGGLFAVIALNFTVYSTYVVLADGDNTVNRLFALNYLALATALFVNIFFGRFNVLARAFSPYVQEQAYLVIMWAVPVLVAITAAAFMLTAAV